MKKGLILGVLLTMLLVLSGCMKADYNININKDGSGVLEIAMLYNNEVLSYISDLQKSKDELKKKGFEVSDYKTETQTGYKGTKKVASYEEMSKLLGEMNKGGNAANQGVNLKVEKNKLTITGLLDFSTDNSEEMNTLLKQVEININVKTPFKVLENNATKVEGDVYTWKIDLTAKNEIKFVADTSDKMLIVLIILGVAVLMVIILFITVAIKNINKKRNVVIEDLTEKVELVDEEEIQKEIKQEDRDYSIDGNEDENKNKN
ncbi:MAG: hypothetical protein A2Y24_06475 [Clostridiales bacterium GWE2_32_10]|nr:MAG: hypothetical protein A2Y24_06475 [Clostridiales bacterium GWE2_32_10]HBY20844.1 hypothetical protein [Clostridiales bacterium]